MLVRYDNGLPAFLKELIEIDGITNNKELAERIGITERTFYQWLVVHKEFEECYEECMRKIRSAFYYKAAGITLEKLLIRLNGFEQTEIETLYNNNGEVINKKIKTKYIEPSEGFLQYFAEKILKDKFITEKITDPELIVKITNV